MKISLKKRQAVSPVIATLLLIAIAVAAAIIVYAFVTGLIGGLTGSTSGIITATASLTVPSGNGDGVLVVSITNSGSNPITGIQVTYTGMEDDVAPNAICMGQTPGLLQCGAAGAGGTTGCGTTNDAAGPDTVPFCQEIAGVATKIQTADPLAVGAQASATDNVEANPAGNLQSGNTYAMTVTVDFANGGTHTQALSATAQL